jgi:glyoxylase-like metal-dependent hydrolase (beta-lactamase superfamily II)
MIESGPYSTYPHLIDHLKASGRDEIPNILLTHIHLDHAGAAWAFAQNGSQVYLHEKGYSHMHNPEKLWSSAQRIYGDQMDTLWGKMEGIPEDKLNIVEDRQVLSFGSIQIEALYTPGHAIHHFSWKLGDEIFTGDVAGVKIHGGPVMPPCPPPDINIEHWLESIALLRSLKPKALHLTHFGRVKAVAEHLDQLESVLWEWADWIKPYYEQEEPQDKVVPLFQEYVRNQLIRQGQNEHGIEKYEAANPSWMSVAGLYRYWHKKLTV